MSLAPSQERTLIDELLAEQQRLTAVERFSQVHARGHLPAQAKYYQALLPWRPPGEGEQLAFSVDLDACTGCKGCVTACHNLNGLDDDEVWRAVGVLYGGTSEQPFQQTVTAACHHCVDPACLNGCPVNAYDKDPVTGIVKHLDDQCIGCQYCMLKCPYDVPRYSEKRGIVRKCDMCASRLAVGEAPACVQACPNQAIRITVVNKAEIARAAEAGHFLPGAPEPAYTQPTTRYLTKRTFPQNVKPADQHALRPGHAHSPLVVMLVLTQLSVGAFTINSALHFISPALMAPLRAGQSIVALLLGLLAISASVFHLGRPLHAWRSFVGLRTSWLSREILVFGAFAALAVAQSLSSFLPRTLLPLPPKLPDLLEAATSLAGLLGVYCSMMIYQDTRRAFWRPELTTLKFAGTTLLLGAACVLFTLCLQASIKHSLLLDPGIPRLAGLLSGAVAAAACVKISSEFTVFIHLKERGVPALKRTALLMSGPLKKVTVARATCGILGGLAAPLLLPLASYNLLVALAAFALLVGGELLERHLFFTAVIPPKMPGGIPG